MPIEPNGTRPISILRPESRSQSSDPVPMPRENTARSSVTTFSSPCSVSRANGVNDVRNTEPKNHSHEIPISELNTARWRAAIARLRHVSENGFQLIARPASAEGEDGTNWAAARPSRATPTHAHETYAGPASLTRIPPAMVPSRIATKVPISTRPLPPVSSEADRCCGRYAYFTGPNRVEWHPMRNTQT